MLRLYLSLSVPHSLVYRPLSGNLFREPADFQAHLLAMFSILTVLSLDYDWLLNSMSCAGGCWRTGRRLNRFTATPEKPESESTRESSFLGATSPRKASQLSGLNWLKKVQLNTIPLTVGCAQSTSWKLSYQFGTNKCQPSDRQLHVKLVLVSYSECSSQPALSCQ